MCSTERNSGWGYNPAANQGLGGASQRASLSRVKAQWPFAQIPFSSRAARRILMAPDRMILLYYYQAQDSNIYRRFTDPMSMEPTPGEERTCRTWSASSFLALFVFTFWGLTTGACDWSVTANPRLDSPAHDTELQKDRGSNCSTFNGPLGGTIICTALGRCYPQT